MRVVELAGIGPAPFAAMLLADLGAQVIRVERPAAGGALPGGLGADVLGRGRRSVALDLKDAEAVEAARALADGSDVLVEGFRPGVAERLGLGPDELCGRNPRLVYGRMTGWGQHGPLAERAGHDLDYGAVAGALHPIGEADRPPPPPLNYVGDFGGGGMLLALGVCAALVERATSGRGQVIDAAMVDGAALQTAMHHGFMAAGVWQDRREANLLDGAAPFYRCYACADGRFVAVGALEPQFYAELLDRLGLDPADWPQQDRGRWPALRRRLEEVFAGRPRQHWEEVFAGSDACVAPVRSLAEAPDDPHLAARGTFAEVDGVVQPAPAPRLSRTPGRLGGAPRPPGADTVQVLAEVGWPAERIDDLVARGAAGTAEAG